MGGTRPAADPDAIATLADRCVMCGMCLPSCPTYAVSVVEGRSPRGRIASMRALANDPGAATPEMLSDLASCLGCGRCEAACPSQVGYAQLLHRTRADLRATHGESWTMRLLRGIALRPWLMRVLLRIARAVPRGIEADPARGGWRALLALARAVPPTRPATNRAAGVGETYGKVLLLTGCVGPAVEGDTHHAAAALIAALGHEVVLQPEGLCCGSLARQAGALDAADRDAARLRRAVARMSGLAAVIGCASGCLGAQRQALAAAGVPPVEDLLDFLGCRPGHATPALHGARVALMVPCTQRTLDRGAAARAALRAIRGVTTVELEDAAGCCGAGALQFMADPETAATLRRRRVAQIAASGATMVATTNTGCRIHLRAGLAEAGLDLPVVHPAAIIGAAIPDPETDPPCADRPPRTA